MYKNILEYLEETKQKYPNKLAFVDAKREATYKEIVENSRKIGMALAKKRIEHKPIAIFIIDVWGSIWRRILYNNRYKITNRKNKFDFKYSRASNCNNR